VEHSRGQVDPVWIIHRGIQVDPAWIIEKDRLTLHGS